MKVGIMTAARRKPLRIAGDFREKIAEALAKDVLMGSGAWRDLEALSGHTEINEIEVLTDEITGTPKEAEGIFNVYVTLNYNDEDDFQSSDAYPGRFKARIRDDGNVEFNEISVDTSSFYA